MAISIMDKLKKLNSGETVKCSSCEEGEYKPLGEDYKTCCHFKCDKCGKMLIATKKLPL